MTQKSESFLHIETIHRAEISWFWTDEFLHDTDYHMKVYYSVNKKIESIVQKYDIQEDTRYCTQFEGVLLYGNDLKNIQSAGLELAKYISSFSGVISL